MSVFKPTRGKTYRYDFWFKSRRYVGNTGQVTEAAAQLAAREVELKLRHAAAGIADFFEPETPRFTDWGPAFVAYKRRKLARPDHMEAVVPVLLRFWGAAPKGAARTPLMPYHDLRLGDVVSDPSWILKFDQWMDRRGLGNQSKNHYRGFMRRMYAVAMQPEFRKDSGIRTNPFLGVANDRTMERTVTVSPKQLRAWLSAASYHVRLAIAIAALAPKLRLRNILDLQWVQHFDPDPRETSFNPRKLHYLRLIEHKTAYRTGRPMVTPIGTQLLAILKDAYTRAPTSEHVVTYRGVAVRSIRGGVQAAAEQAKIPYGRDTAAGVTFHTLRHTAASLISAREADPLKLRDAMGHESLSTSMRYRHLAPRHERATLERLSSQLPILDLVTTKRRRAAREKKVG